VIVEPEGVLAGILGEARIMVNSLHRQAIDTLAPGLRIEARAEDGTIEAVSLRRASGFVLGVQWHPEYKAAANPVSVKIFRAFGEAARRYALRRSMGITGT